MHLPKHHVETDLRVIRQLIRDNPLALFTTAIDSPDHPFMQSSHIPIVLDIEDEESLTEKGRIRFHIARLNPQSKAMIEELTASGAGSGGVLERDVLLIFTSTHHYITPKFYTETKPVTGKVVPTWNYAAAQVYGRAKVYFDSKAEETTTFLKTQLTDLSRDAEEGIMKYDGKNGREAPWVLADAPERYLELLAKNIIGVEVEITRIEGKFKMSQEMKTGDRQGVVDGMMTQESEAAQHVGRTVRDRGALKDASARA